MPSSTREDQPSPGKARQKVWRSSSSWYRPECEVIVTPSRHSEQFWGKSVLQPPTNLVHGARSLGLQKSACARCRRSPEFPGEEDNTRPPAELARRRLPQSLGPEAGGLPGRNYQVLSSHKARARPRGVANPLAVKVGDGQKVVVEEGAPRLRHGGVVPVVREQHRAARLARAEAWAFVVQHHEDVVAAAAGIPVWGRRLDVPAGAEGGGKGGTRGQRPEPGLGMRRLRVWYPCAVPKASGGVISIITHNGRTRREGRRRPDGFAHEQRPLVRPPLCLTRFPAVIRLVCKLDDRPHEERRQVDGNKEE
eukprot:scaffold345_cov104-Isochrysis_galbana.AAC.8